MAATDSDTAQLEESLRQCRLELAAVRAEQETWAEQVAPLAFADQQLIALSTALDEFLTKREYVVSEGLRGKVARRLRSHALSAEEAAQVKRIRASGLFDGPWYLREYPDVAGTGLSPALHFLRHGRRERRNPCADFDTQDYLNTHRDLPRGVNPLLHYLDSIPGAGR